MHQIDLFENYSYSIGPWAKKKKQTKKKCKYECDSLTSRHTVKSINHSLDIKYSFNEGRRIKAQIYIYNSAFYNQTTNFKVIKPSLLGL